MRAAGTPEGAGIRCRRRVDRRDVWLVRVAPNAAAATAQAVTQPGDERQHILYDQEEEKDMDEKENECVAREAYAKTVDQQYKSKVKAYKQSKDSTSIIS